MNLSWLEISALYLAGLAVATDVLCLGGVYHDPTVMGVGFVGVLYTGIRGMKALEIWWKMDNPKEKSNGK